MNASHICERAMYEISWVNVLIAALVLTMSTESRADSPITQGINLGGGTQAGAAAGAWADSSSSSAGGAGGIGNGGTAYGGQGGVGTGGAAHNNGNVQSTNFDQVRQSPTMFLNVPSPTAPCQASIGGFVSFIAGAGIAGSRTLEECEIRETARIAHGVGQPGMAKSIICRAKYAKDTPECEINQ